MTAAVPEQAKKEYVHIQRLFVPVGTDPFEMLEWKRVDAVITNPKGEEKFRQDNIEVPAWWSETQWNIVAEKYFRVVNGVKEYSARQMFHRVAHWLAYNGVKQGIFLGDAFLLRDEPPTLDNLGYESIDAKAFYDELVYMGLNGMHAFNSPVWFNVGVKQDPQCSACFIQSAGDRMTDIMDLAKREVMLFKGGSGTGSNLSPLRSSYETLSTGGLSSGPVSFMEGFDAFAGVTKSGGSTRRAAKMVVLNINHPDILIQKNGKPGFITCKADAEQMAHDLYSTGKYSAEFNDPNSVYARVPFQNANNSVRVTDEFMLAVENDSDWSTVGIKNKKIINTYKARHLWNEIAKAAWACGDPGLQFDTVTNLWHTCKASGRINASNPCQPEWAPFLTPEGIRTLGEINVGDTIWSGKQWTKVKRKVFTGIKPVYHYYTRAGIFSGTEEHQIISNGERVQIQHAETIDTAIGHTIWTNIHLDIQTVVDGLVLGDGYIKVSNDGADHYPLLCVGKNDQSYFQESVAKFINLQEFDKLAHRVKTTLVRGELPRKHLLTVPSRFLRGDKNKVCSFLRGLYSANGSVVDGRITLKAASFTLITQVQQMLSSLGIRSYYTTNRANDVEFINGVYTCKENYDLNITGNRREFANLIGFIQPYKQDKLMQACEIGSPARGPKTSFEVVSKMLVGDEPVFDIEVEAEEHTYWTGGLLVSNCSEYLYLDDTACNLSSLNLRKFTKNKAFDIGAFIHATQLAIIAKEIIVDASSYPSPLIKERSNKYRTLGLGYTNLGSLLTYWGLPYDSNQGRAVAAAITAIMGGVAYSMSAHLAKVQGPFPGYTESDENISNKDSMYEVMLQHLEAAKRIPVSYSRLWASLYDSAIDVWKDAVDLGRQYGYRNAQVTVMAPTGTISFLMDADTTGAEPNLGIVTFKKLVGGGYMKMPNRVVEPALHNLGYDREVIPIILEHIKEKGEIWSAPGFDSAKHGSIFAEALGDHALSPEAHIDMMAAIQPFLSGGISKTVNMPSNATVEDVTKLYMRAWKSGIKCVAIYRDGCKLSQPIATSLTETGKKEKALAWGERKRLPATRDSKTHRFTVGGQEGYITISFYADTGTLAEMFIRLAKTGSTMHGILDAWAIAVSMALQAGTPFDILKERYIDMRFDPSGITDDPAIRIAKSIPDYIFRWLDLHYGDKAETLEKITIEKIPDTKTNYDGPPCSKCGNITQRSGSCWLCKTCGNTTGCS